MTLKEQMAGDAKSAFLNTGEFAESVTYTPKGGTAKVLNAVINRKRLDPASEDIGRVLINQCEIFIANDATAGVASISKGGDIVSFSENIAGSVINWIVADILGQDEGIWHLLVQK